MSGLLFHLFVYLIYLVLFYFFTFAFSVLFGFVLFVHFVLLCFVAFFLRYQSKGGLDNARDSESFSRRFLL